MGRVKPLSGINMDDDKLQGYMCRQRIQPVTSTARQY